MSFDSPYDDATRLPGCRGEEAPVAPVPALGDSIGGALTDHGQSDPTEVSPAPGTLIGGRFEVRRELGRGGMGVVHLCHDPITRRAVAVKRLRAGREHGQSALERFNREVRAIAGLSHPNVVALHDCGVDAFGPYFTMEYLEGMDLGAWVTQHGPMQPSEALRVVREACKGLAYAHGKGILHRDLKPTNLFRLADGSIKLLDFGLALSGEESERSAPVVGLGTLDYCAPEQRSDARRADARSDLYSLGATLYFLATGRSPKVIRESLLPTGLRDFVLRLLEDDPRARPPGVLEAIVELDRVRAALGGGESGGVDVDDLHCPSPGCRMPNALEAKFCAACRWPLQETCPACLASRRKGLRACNQCGAVLHDWKELESLLTAAEAARAHGDLAMAISMLDSERARSLSNGSTLGAGVGRMNERLRQLRSHLQAARDSGLRAMQQARRLAAAGQHAGALGKLEEACGFDRDLDTQAESLRMELRGRDLAAQAQLGRIRSVVRELGELVAAGRYGDTGRLLEQAESLMAAGASLGDAGLREELQRCKAALVAARHKAATLKDQANRLERGGDLESARAVAGDALALDRSLQPWHDELTDRVRHALERQGAAKALARQLAGECAQDLRQGSLADAERKAKQLDGVLRGMARSLEHELRGTVTQTLAEIARRRERLKTMPEQVKDFCSQSRFENAQVLLDEAERLERGLRWVAEDRSNLQEWIRRRNEAAANAERVAASIGKVGLLDALADKQLVLDQAERLLRKDAPGLSVGSLEAAKSRVAAARQQRNLFVALLFVAVVVVAMAFS